MALHTSVHGISNTLIIYVQVAREPWLPWKPSLLNKIAIISQSRVPFLILSLKNIFILKICMIIVGTICSMIHILCNLQSLYYLLGSIESFFSFPHLSWQDISHRFLSGYFLICLSNIRESPNVYFIIAHSTPTCRSTVTTVIVGRAQLVTFLFEKVRLAQPHHTHCATLPPYHSNRPNNPGIHKI